MIRFMPAVFVILLFTAAVFSIRGADTKAAIAAAIGWLLCVAWATFA